VIDSRVIVCLRSVGDRYEHAVRTSVFYRLAQVRVHVRPLYHREKRCAEIDFDNGRFFIGLADFIPHVTKARQQQQILAAIVMISITAPNWQETSEKVEIVLPIPNDEYRTMARADGKVVADGLATACAVQRDVMGENT
jgi:hypothetical protein